MEAEAARRRKKRGNQKREGGGEALKGRWVKQCKDSIEKHQRAEKDQTRKAGREKETAIQKRKWRLKQRAVDRCLMSLIR